MKIEFSYVVAAVPAFFIWAYYGAEHLLALPILWFFYLCPLVALGPAESLDKWFDKRFRE